MIKLVEFKNFKALRDTKLPLSPFTLLVGPNGSGKSTALEGIKRAAGVPTEQDMSVGAVEQEVSIIVHWGEPLDGVKLRSSHQFHSDSQGKFREYVQCPAKVQDKLNIQLAKMRVFSLEPQPIAASVMLQPNMQLLENGSNLAGVLDRLRDQAPDRFEALNEELRRWLPEFDRVLFDTPSAGKRSIMLRTQDGNHSIPASNLSDGTLMALALLTIAYLPDPPPIIGLEEPDRGIHPRLLREVRDAIYRLTYPDQYGEKREPVQVIATTHSPTMVDLYRDHPEEIVIAQKEENNIRFERLTDQPHFEEILEDTPLGEAWYSGILGGVPAGS